MTEPLGCLKQMKCESHCPPFSYRRYLYLRLFGSGLRCLNQEKEKNERISHHVHLTQCHQGRAALIMSKLEVIREMSGNRFSKKKKKRCYSSKFCITV